MELPRDSIIAIGDIHGCYQALESLLRVLLPLPNRVVFLGDYVDRGPSSPKVIGLLVMAKLQRPDWVFLLGNHEYMLLQDIEANLPPFGQHSAYDQYLEIGGVPKAHLDFIEELSVYWESEKFLFMHAGIEGDVELAPANRAIDEMIWTYKISKEWQGKTLVRGHFVIDDPEQFDNYIGLDTGCVFEGWLTAGVLDDREGLLLGAVQVKSDGTRLRMWKPA